MVRLATVGNIIIPIYEGTKDGIGYWILKRGPSGSPCCLRLKDITKLGDLAGKEPRK